jgi:hypothetical protein
MNARFATAKIVAAVQNYLGPFVWSDDKTGRRSESDFHLPPVHNFIVRLMELLDKFKQSVHNFIFFFFRRLLSADPKCYRFPMQIWPRVFKPVEVVIPVDAPFISIRLFRLDTYDVDPITKLRVARTNLIWAYREKEPAQWGSMSPRIRSESQK